MKLNFTEEKRFEKLATEVFPTAQEGSVFVAKSIAKLIRDKQAKGENAVLGLATGSTPIQVYEELVRMHKEEGLSFKNVITFNLDEYYPMPPNSIHSYVYFMNEYLFNHVDIKPENIHIPDGTLPSDKIDEVVAYCASYEEKIAQAGGIDLQILGIGRNGHIGFNEPGSAFNSGTRLITLDNKTRMDAAGSFYGKENVPRRAITMGIGTILHAKSIILMAWSAAKSETIQRTLEGEISNQVPATFLQQHPDVQIIIDEAAAAELTRFKTPWLVKMCDWDDKMTKRAAVWLCLKLGKPILKLTDQDYNENGMSDLIAQQGPAYNINIRLFNQLQHTITGWPGGKPYADDTHRPERAFPVKKRVVIFSPHPDDDVISMGGTFLRLVEQGHDVHVAYQTSGNIAVFDDDALRFIEFASDFNKAMGNDNQAMKQLIADMRKFMNEKNIGHDDSPEVRMVKGLIRKGEATAACRFCGIPAKNAHFLNMPFYETGKTRKKPLGEDDIQVITDLLNEIQPHQIYAAGDLADPHGTHRVCLDAIFEAMARLNKSQEWTKDCYLWLYRGAWHEWGIEEIEMAVPLSPQEVEKKRKAIFKHQSQKDTAVFPGNDPREFWQRAEDRNRQTAKLYDALGLAEYEAMEAFVRWKF
jgi:glucosamine-6-phosphate deaminase